MTLVFTYVENQKLDMDVTFKNCILEQLSIFNVPLKVLHEHIHVPRKNLKKCLIDTFL
jgi:hypothetical protein